MFTVPGGSRSRTKARETVTNLRRAGLWPKRSSFGEKGNCWSWALRTLAVWEPGLCMSFLLSDTSSLTQGFFVFDFLDLVLKGGQRLHAFLSLAFFPTVIQAAFAVEDELHVSQCWDYTCAPIHFILFYFLSVWNRVLLCSPGWLAWNSLHKAALQLKRSSCLCSP